MNPKGPRTVPRASEGGADARVKWELTRKDREFDTRRPTDDLPVFEELSEIVPSPKEHAHQAVMSPGAPIAEEFRVLRAKVRAIGEERPFRCFGLVSSAPGEGKTTVSLGLANAMALEREDRRVLLVEADLRKRMIARYLGLAPASGLSEWLQGDPSAPLPIRRLGARGPFLLAAGVSSPPNPEVLSSGRVGQMLEACRRCFDYVIVDCPPLAPVADSIMLEDLLDGFLLVVRARHAPREAVLRALSQLTGDRIQGVVFNDYHEILMRPYSYAQSRY
jgi:capsular exopolysaccharide synthesis family protein